MLDITNGSLTYATRRPHRRRYGERLSLGACVRLIALWHDRACQRRILAAMDDRRLSDIGVTRLEAERECGKPFWR